jgi:hypothetical protein
VQPTKTTIPTYAANGARLRDRSLDSVLRLEELKKVALKRDRRGRVRGCQFLSDAGANPIRKSAHMGQRYSYMKRIGEHARIWQHRQLDNDLRGIFLRVALDCKPKPAPAAPGDTPARRLARAIERNNKLAKDQSMSPLDSPRMGGDA